MQSKMHQHQRKCQRMSCTGQAACETQRSPPTLHHLHQQQDSVGVLAHCEEALDHENLHRVVGAVVGSVGLLGVEVGIELGRGVGGSGSEPNQATDN
jgi:hypothetical protein